MPSRGGARVVYRPYYASLVALGRCALSCALRAIVLGRAHYMRGRRPFGQAAVMVLATLVPVSLAARPLEELGVLEAVGEPLDAFVESMAR